MVLHIQTLALVISVSFVELFFLCRLFTIFSHLDHIEIVDVSITEAVPMPNYTTRIFYSSVGE